MMFTKTREKRNKTIPFGRVGTEYPEIKEAFDRLDLLRGGLRRQGIEAP